MKYFQEKLYLIRYSQQILWFYHDVKLTYLVLNTWFDVQQNQMNKLVVLAIFKMTDKIVSLFELKKPDGVKEGGLACVMITINFLDDWMCRTKYLCTSKREVFCGVLACHSGDFFKYNWQKLAAVFLPSFCDSKGFFKWNLGETQAHTQIFKRMY